MAVSSIRAIAINNTLMPAPPADGQIAAPDFRMLITSGHSIGALDQKRFDINTGTGDSDRMFFTRTLVVLQSKPCPGA